MKKSTLKLFAALIAACIAFALVPVTALGAEEGAAMAVAGATPTDAPAQTPEVYPEPPPEASPTDAPAPMAAPVPAAPLAGEVYNITYNLLLAKGKGDNPDTYTAADLPLELKRADYEDAGFTHDGWYKGFNPPYSYDRFLEDNHIEFLRYAKAMNGIVSSSYELYIAELSENTDAFTGSIDKITDTSIGDITLYAKPSVSQSFTIYVPLGGIYEGINPVTVNTIQLGSAFRTGFDFAGWYEGAKTEDGELIANTNSKGYAKGEQFSPSQVLNFLYAAWEPAGNQVTVRWLDPADEDVLHTSYGAPGEGLIDPANPYYSKYEGVGNDIGADTDVPPIIPERDGYYFDGYWYRDKALTQRWDFGSGDRPRPWDSNYKGDTLPEDQTVELILYAGLRPIPGDDPPPDDPPAPARAITPASRSRATTKFSRTPIVAILRDVEKQGDVFTFKTFIANGSGDMAGKTVTVSLNEKYFTSVTIGEDGFGEGRIEAPGYAFNTANFGARPNVPGGVSVGTEYAIYGDGRVVRRG